MCLSLEPSMVGSMPNWAVLNMPETAKLMSCLEHGDPMMSTFLPKLAGCWCLSFLIVIPLFFLSASKWLAESHSLPMYIEQVGLPCSYYAIKS